MQPVEDYAVSEDVSQDTEFLGHLDRALHAINLIDFEDEIELYKTYGGD